jgi:hypothetical protein
VRRLAALLFALALAAPAGAQLLPIGSLVVKMSSPANGATVSGTVAVGASVTIVGTLTVARVDFYTGGSFIGSDASAPYAVSWDSRSVANGSHSLRAVAQDILGARWNADPITVTAIPPPRSATSSNASGSRVARTGSSRRCSSTASAST